MSKITSEQLELVIYSLSRPNGGGVDLFLKEHAVEFAILLEEHVLPELKKQEEIALNIRQHHYTDEEYEFSSDEDEGTIWDGFSD